MVGVGRGAEPVAEPISGQALDEDSEGDKCEAEFKNTGKFSRNIRKRGDDG